MPKHIHLAELRHLFKRHPAFSRVFLADIATQVGDGGLVVVFPMLILDATHDVTITGVAFAGEILAFGLFSPLAGTVADRLEQKTVMMLANALRAIWLGMLLFTLSNHGPLAVCLVFSLLLGATGAFFTPARAAFLRRLLDGEDLQQAIALEGTMAFLMRLIAPALMGLLLAYFPPTVGIVIDIVSLVLSVALLAPRWVTGPWLGAEVSEASTGWGKGWRFILESPTLSSLLALDIAVSVCGTATFSLTVAFLEQALHLPARNNGWLMATAGIAGAVGTRLAHRLGHSPKVYAGLITLIASTYLAVPLSGNFPTMLLVWSFRALGVGIFCVLLNQRIAQEVPAHVMGRVQAAWGLCACLAAFSGSAMTPLLLRSIGAGAAYTLFGVILGLVALAMAIVQFQAARAVDSQRIEA